MAMHEVQKPFLASQFGRKREWSIGIAYKRIQAMGLHEDYVMVANLTKYRQNVGELIKTAKEFPPPYPKRHKDFPHITKDGVMIVPLFAFDIIETIYPDEQLELGLGEQ